MTRPSAGHDVAGAQRHEVSADDLGDGQLMRSPIPHDGCPKGQARLQGRHRRLGAGFLHEPEGRAHDDDGKDDRGIDRVADDEAHETRADKDQDERAGQLGDQDREARPAPAAADPVRAVEPEALRGRGAGQPVGAAGSEASPVAVTVAGFGAAASTGGIEPQRVHVARRPHRHKSGASLDGLIEGSCPGPMPPPGRDPG